MTPAIPAAVAELAEDLNISLPPSPGSERLLGDGYAIWFGAQDHPAFNVVQRIRLEGVDVEAALAEVRAAARSRGRTACTWEIGSSARPVDIESKLLALGLEPWEEPDVVGLVLLEPPEWTPPAVPIRLASGFDDHLEAARIFAEAFEVSAEDGGEPMARELALANHREQQEGRKLVYLATLDGRTIAAAIGIPTPVAMVLGAAATREGDRGRGAYRALVAHRAAAAQAAGLGALVVQAGPMSRPILERLGFVESCRIRVLVDRV